MFLSSLTSNDPRLKSIHFHAGLNILVADRTAESGQGDSRNSSGKTSVVKTLRYLLGSDLPKEFQASELAEHTFTATLNLVGSSGEDEEVTVSRGVSPTTKLTVAGWSSVVGSPDVHIDEWRELQARHLFKLPDDVTRPTVGQLWAQLARLYFTNPTKGHPSEPDWETGVKLGFMLGLSPEILGQAGDLDRLTKQRKAIRAAVKEGAMTHLSLDEPALRAQLATARRRRDRTQADLRSFKVDAQYGDHQREADRLTASIQALNDEGLALQRRSGELRTALQDELVAGDSAQVAARLERIYGEMGFVLPDSVARRYDEVAQFHQSVIRNRRSFLEQELDAVNARLRALDGERTALDERRAQVMRLLSETVALDTFLTLQSSLAEQEADVADLERRLEAAASIGSLGDRIKLRTAELTSSLRTEMGERAGNLDAPISLFGELGAEIYTDREASLLISPTEKGILKVQPEISGDASTGVKNVETFMLDMVCAISAMGLGRAPRLLVHDSHLFDAIDGRQVASCLNIGARLAETHGFQYLVTLNSDFLASVVAQSDGAFDPAPYMLETRLTDATEDGGFFGFRFD